MQPPLLLHLQQSRRVNGRPRIRSFQALPTRRPSGNYSGYHGKIQGARAPFEWPAQATRRLGAPHGVMLSNKAFFTASSFASVLIIFAWLCLIAMSGSFGPCPVWVQTILLPAAILPRW